jgi:hypothetical protein
MLRRCVSRRQMAAEWFHEIQDIVTTLLIGALVMASIIALAGCAWMTWGWGSLGEQRSGDRPPVLPSADVPPAPVTF